MWREDRGLTLMQRMLILVLAATLAACGSKKNESDAAAGESRKQESVETSPDGLIIVPALDKPHDPIPDPSPKSDSTEPARYIVWWSAEMCFDGFYDFVVHPNQLFLRTENFKSNPKPDVVVWQLRISDEQHRAITTYLEARTSKAILPEEKRQHAGYTLFRMNDLERRVQVPPGNYNSETHGRACRELTTRNLEDLLDDLTHGVRGDVFSLPGPVSLTKQPLKILKQ
jgi:hypothetical protein